MSTTMNIKLLNVTKTTSQWAEVESAGTVISKGLLCIEIDTNNKTWAKVGDGVHTWASLPYITDAAIESLGTLFRVKGIKASISELPTTGNQVGDVWFVGSASTAGQDKFEEYIWTSNNVWEFLGKVSDPVIPVYTGGTGITIDSEDVINLDIATDSTLGGIKVGNNLTVDSTTGVLDATDTTYTLSGAYGTGNSTWVTTLTPSSGTATTSTTPTATTSVYGITKLTNSTSSTSTTTAATPNSVKNAYDLASSKSIVSVGGILETGTTIATVTVNGKNNDIKVPNTGITASSATTGVVELSANTKYSLSAGGSSVIFKTPAGAVYEFADNYKASTNKGATVATVTNAINALDGGTIGTGSASKTITSLSQTNGNVSATFGDISISHTQVTGLGAAALKAVTDNSTPTAVTSSDTNLITGRTLYNAGYAKADDVVTDVKINGSSIVTNNVASVSGIAKSVSVNGGTAATADETTGQVSLTGIVTGLNYTNSSGATTTISPTNGNLDLTSLILNCTL